MKLKSIFISTQSVPRIILLVLVLFAVPAMYMTYKRLRYGFLGYEILHALRVNYQRIPAPSYIFKKPPTDVKGLVEELNKNGIIKISNFLSPQDLKQLREEFEGMVTYIDQHAKDVQDKGNGFTEDYYDAVHQQYVSSNPLKYTKKLGYLCCDNNVLGIINHYLQGDAHINYISAARTLSSGKHGIGSFQWHHDAWGNKLHVMFLLTDVEEGDQYMTYVMGSHKMKHSLDTFMHSRLNLDYAKTGVKGIHIFKCMGKAGDIFIFDPNAVHSGNRTDGKVRDTFIVSYTRDRTYVWNLDVPKEICQVAPADYPNPFKQILALKSKNPSQELFPKIKCWDQGLTAVNLWI